uniref:EF-hand domain-containing protein n=2 Tax=Hanusia phi TaxID=3032 RepID=A0A7S0EKY9_9CRYP|mmetsp:Transcript_26709/g.60975  ORF Transcript_26709/g.60975 Transcript_26709/m.60975 type:complete len:287 (+) Transcript_26709:856-1716(+)
MSDLHSRPESRGNASTLPDSFVRQRRLGNTQVLEFVLRQVLQQDGAVNTLEMLSNLEDDKGFIPSLQLKAMLIDLNPNEDDMEKINVCIAALDKSGAGQVDWERLRRLIARLKHGVVTSNEKPLSSQKLPLTELLGIIQPKLGSMFRSAQQAMTFFDKNRTGFLDPIQFRMLLEQLQVDVQEEEMEGLLKLLITNSIAMVDVSMLVRGFFGQSDRILSLANQSSSAMLLMPAPKNTGAETQEASNDFPSRLDMNAIAQHIRKQWRQSYPMPCSAGQALSEGESRRG